MRRAPPPVLRPFVHALWAIDGTGPPSAAARERVLPTGAMHLALRVSDAPFRFFDDAGAAGLESHAVVGGARAVPYLKEIATPAVSVGAHLRPGASALLFGAPAVELAGRHTPLAALWGRVEAETRERLMEAGSPAARLDVLEETLAARLPRARALHPAVALALTRFDGAVPVGDVVRETGYSHRRFIDLFRHAVGLPPKLYCRLLRFQHAFVRLADDPPPAAARVAFELGYSDQAHLIRDFRELAGITPGAYQGLAGLRPGHAPAQRAEP